MIRLDINRGKWANSMRTLSRLLGKSVDEIVKSQARLIVRDCIKATPPFTPGRNWTEGLAAQRKIGQQAVLGDIRRLLKPASGFAPLADGGRLAGNVRELILRGQNADALEVLRRSKMQFEGIIPEATPSFHKDKRDKRGRTRKGKGYLVHDGSKQSFNPNSNPTQTPDDPAIRRIVTDKQAMVGNAKAGWTIAARALGQPIPPWVRKQRGATSGKYVEQGSGLRLSVTVANTVPYIQQSGRDLRIIAWAKRNRERNMDKQIKTILRKQRVTK